MIRHQSQTLPRKKRAPNKLIAGFAALAATAVITASGFAAAAPASKPSKDDCNNAGFKNYGQCVKEWTQQKNKIGGGYGNTSVATNVDLTLNNSNHNIIHVIVNIFR